ncbi:MAG: hypothetical protein K8H99_00420 [Nitrospirae bacterium]|nr:hypothetical protein [Fimbriimonadaceae bacterium]
MSGDVIIYTSPDGVAKVEVHFEDETFWLPQRGEDDLASDVEVFAPKRA